MQTLKSLDQLFELFPHHKIYNSVYHSPCPFCQADKESDPSRIHTKNEHVFVGDDRFIRDFSRYDNWYCTHCQRVYNLADIVVQLGVQLAEDFNEIIPDDYLEHKKLELYLADENYVTQLHQNVQRHYWYAFGWNDQIIDQFKLGYGVLYPHSNRSPRHIIPFVPHTNEGGKNGYALEGRRSAGADSTEPKVIRTSGIGKEYFWQDVIGSKKAIITEGIKDGISARLCFNDVDLYAILGNATDRENLSTYIQERNYQSILVLADNDESGSDYLNSFLSDLENIYTVQWPNNAKKGYDLTDLLVQYGAENVRKYTEQMIYQVSIPIERGYVSDVRMFYPGYVPPSPSGLSRDETRDELPDVLDDFIENYMERRKYAGKGIVKVLGVDPGTGKSFAMVDLAEKLSEKVMEDYKRSKTQLNMAIKKEQEYLLLAEDEEEKGNYLARIETFQKRIQNLSCAKILYAGPFINGWEDILQHGANPDLWYNLEARNKDNCENLSTVSALAQKGYVPMNFCQVACPFKQNCKYLKQLDERKTKPITYVRHQSLQTSLIDEYRYILIDENCLSVFDEPIKVDASQLYPTYSDYWDEAIDADQRALILEFIDAIRMGMNANIGKNTIISGREWMNIINDLLMGKLIETLTYIDPKNLNEYHPKTVMGDFNYDELPMRCIPIIFDVMQRELELYVSDQLNYNSGIHLINGELEIYPLDKVSIPTSRPIIIADGTAFPDLYGMLFDREVEIYRPSIYKEESSTTVYYGSDFTRTSINTQVGNGLMDLSRWLKENRLIVEDLFGETFDLNELPVDENLYDSVVLRRMLTLLKMTAEKHSSVLFVTYKNIRILLEKRMSELYPDLHAKIHYAHYGSLRGTNRYKEVESVLLIGCPRMSYSDMHRKIQAWAKLADQKYVPFRIINKVAPYHGVEIYAGHTYTTFDNEFADRFLTMFEAGEVRQAMERIRIYTSDVPKFAYLALSRPSGKWVKEISPLGRVINQYEDKRFAELKQELTESYLTFNKFPKYNKLTQKYKVSTQTITEMRNEVKTRIDSTTHN